MQYPQTPETLLWQKRAGIITESQYNLLVELTDFFNLMEAEAPDSGELNNLVKKVADAGANVKDKNVQLDLLDKALDADFDFSKIDPKKITEYKQEINESGGGFIGSAIAYLEDAEGAEAVMHGLGTKNPGIISTILKWLKKLAEFPFKIIEKFFYRIARFFGAGIETASIAGTSGMVILTIICLAYAVMHFPTILASLSGGFGIIGLLKLGKALWNAASGIKSLFKKFKSFKRETSKSQMDFTSNDFLTAIEKQYKEKTGKKFSTSDVFDLREWFDHIPDDPKQGDVKITISQLMKNAADAVTQNEKYNNFEKIITLTKKHTPKYAPKVILILRKIREAFPDNLL